MASKFKVGDKVRIKPRVGEIDEYPMGYTQPMCAHVGEYRKIKSVINAEKFEEHIFGKKYYEEPYLYKIDGMAYLWSSSMMDAVEECAKDERRWPCVLCSKEGFYNRIKDKIESYGYITERVDDACWESSERLVLSSHSDSYRCVILRDDISKYSLQYICCSIDEFLVEAKKAAIREGWCLASKFQVGDKVKVMPRIGNQDDYPCSYIDQMTLSVGKIYTIKEVRKFNNICIQKKRLYYKEPFYYILDNDESLNFWSSPMLELADPSSQEVKPKSSEFYTGRFPCVKCTKTEYEDKIKSVLVDLGCDVGDINNNWRNYPMLCLNLNKSNVVAYNVSKHTLTDSISTYGNESIFVLYDSVEEFIEKTKMFVKTLNGECDADDERKGIICVSCPDENVEKRLNEALCLMGYIDNADQPTQDIHPFLFCLNLDKTKTSTFKIEETTPYHMCDSLYEFIDLAHANSIEKGFFKPIPSNFKYPCIECTKYEYNTKIKKTLSKLGCKFEIDNNNWENKPMLYLGIWGDKIIASNAHKETIIKVCSRYKERSWIEICNSTNDFLTKANTLLKNYNKSETFKNNETMTNITDKAMAKSTNKFSSLFERIIEKYKSRMIPVEDDNLKITIDGNIAVLVGDDYIAINKTNQLIRYPKEMCLDFPIWVISKPYSKVKAGDIIKTNGRYSKVMRKNAEDGTIRCVSFSGTTQTKREVKDFLFNQALVPVVINIFDNMQSDGINHMMLMLAGGKSDIKDVMMMSMMSKSFASNSASTVDDMFDGMNPLMMMMLMGKDSNNDSGSLMEMMLMSKMFGGVDLFDTGIATMAMHEEAPATLAKNGNEDILEESEGKIPVEKIE